MENAQTPEAGRTELPDGVFVCGRQHSGNTMLTALLGRMSNFVVTLDEDYFLEARPALDKLPDAIHRARWFGSHLQLRHPQLEAAITKDLLAWAQQHPAADAVSVFRKACALTASTLGKRSWARKATSYIFHADTILNQMPGVRLIYLVRNPFDIIASMKLRQPKREYIVGAALSWTSGIDQALRYEKRFPDRVHVMRYEKLVTDPEAKAKRLCAFLGEIYDPSLLDVPRINTSDQPHAEHASEQGMSASHINYYMTTLSDAEIVATEMLCQRRHLRQLYPSLPHYSRRYPAMVRLKAMWLIASGFIRYPLSVVKRVRRSAFPLRVYLLRRATALWKVPWGSRRGLFGAGLRPALAGLIAVLLGLIAALTRSCFFELATE